MAWTDDLITKRRDRINDEENKKRKWQQTFDTLTPIVEQTLYELGESIWGRTFYGRRKCKVYVKSNCWVLIERKEYNTDEELTEVLLQVSMTPEADRFTLYLRKNKPISSSSSETCKDISENELKEALVRLFTGI